MLYVYFSLKTFLCGEVNVLVLRIGRVGLPHFPHGIIAKYNIPLVFINSELTFEKLFPHPDIFNWFPVCFLYWACNLSMVCCSKMLKMSTVLGVGGVNHNFVLLLLPLYSLIEVRLEISWDLYKVCVSAVLDRGRLIWNVCLYKELHSVNN